MKRRSLAPLLLLCLGVAALPHGGSYRPAPPKQSDPPAPDQPEPPATPSGGPTRPGPKPGPSTPAPSRPSPNAPGAPGTAAAAPSAGPKTPRGYVLEDDGSSALLWWGYNQDEFLRRRDLGGSDGPISGSDDVYFGPSRRVAGSDHLRPSPNEIATRLVPALFAALHTASERHVRTSSLLALAKVGAEPARVLSECRRLLADGEQTVRECAALAIGLLGAADGVPILLELAGDTSEGRGLLQRTEVDERTRAFAIYGLGLLMRAAQDRTGAAGAELAPRIVTALTELLAPHTATTRSLRVAALHALRATPTTVQTHAAERARVTALLTVRALWDRPGGTMHQLVRAHVPVVLADLLGRGGDRSGSHVRVLVAELTADQPGAPWPRQSAALALGDLLLPPELEPEHEPAVAALRRTLAGDRDRQTRGFAAIALARIGGTGNRDALLQRLRTATAAPERPWAMLALGLLEHRRRDGNELPADVILLDALRATFVDARNPEEIATCAIALGLAGAAAEGDLLAQRLDRHLPQDDVAGAIVTGLALLGTDTARSRLLALIDHCERRPDLLRALGNGLAHLRDHAVAERLHQLLADTTQNQPTFVTAASALGTIGDRRSIEPLLTILAADQHPTFVRGNAAMALGGIGDPRELPWNSWLAAGVNYCASVPTLTNGQDGVLDVY